MAELAELTTLTKVDDNIFTEEVIRTVTHRKDDVEENISMLKEEISRAQDELTKQQALLARLK